RRAEKALSGRIDSRALYRQRVQASMRLTFPGLRNLTLTGCQLVAEYGDVGQVPVPLCQIEAVADDEAVGNLEADITHRNVDLAPGGLGHQRADLERGRLARFEVAHQVRE